MTDTLAQLKSALEGRYQIDREIGAGGMATVYLARDVKHDRQVALKVLKAELGAVLGVDRFLAEIKVTANLQHPNLLPLFDSGEANGLLFYVMPYVEGESLRARLMREKQLPVDEAVRLTTGIAAALDFAHRHGVIHRDLKPENILLQDGQPVIADFGIALAVSNAGGARVTQTGLSLGTPQYMSPEQATGDRAIDARSDIYSLAAMTYEMLVGDPPYLGSTAQAIIAKVLTEKPPDVRVARPTVPGHVSHAIAQALEKLAADRWATAQEFSDALAGKLATRSTAELTARASEERWHNSPLLLIAVVVLGAAIGAWGWLGRAAAPEPPTLRTFLDIDLSSASAATGFGSSLAISADGRTIVYVAALKGGPQKLYVRAIGELTARELPGTEGAFMPALEPGGRWIAFISGFQLKKVPLEGGTPLPLASVPNARGLSWGARGDLVIGTSGGPLLVVSAAGGEPRALTTVNADSGEQDHRLPVILPDGETILYTSFAGSATSHISITSLAGGKATRLDLPGTAPLGVIDGQLIYSTFGGALMAVPVDLTSRRVLGSPRPVVNDVNVNTAGAVMAALAQRGSLVYQTGAPQSQLVIVDAKGAARPLMPDLRNYSFPRLSPDGRRIVVSVAAAGGREIWIYERVGEAFARLTSADHADSDRPEWSPDGKRVVFVRPGTRGFWSQPSDFSGPAVPLVAVPGVTVFEAVPSPDGATLLLRVTGGSSVQDIWYRGLSGDTTAKPLIVSPNYEAAPRFSPDGKWIVYTTDPSGRREVIVTPFPGPGPRVQVSTEGGEEPIWSRDGQRIFYRRGHDLMAASVSLGSGFSVTQRTLLFTGPFAGNFFHANYDVSSDGREFVMLQESESEVRTILIHDWRTELRARTAPAAKK